MKSPKVLPAILAVFRFVLNNSTRIGVIGMIALYCAKLVSLDVMYPTVFILVGIDKLVSVVTGNNTLLGKHANVLNKQIDRLDSIIQRQQREIDRRMREMQSVREEAARDLQKHISRMEALQKDLLRMRGTTQQ